MRVVVSDFDIDTFLAKPLMAHLAICDSGSPSETPVWFLWEDESLWMIASSSSSFPKRLREHPRAAIGIVDFDAKRGYLRHVGFRGDATIEPMDVERRERLAGRYLGQEAQWSVSFREAVIERQDVLIRFVPKTVVARDQSYFRHGDSANTLPALDRAEFLRAWHARYAGKASDIFSYDSVEADGRSSYALLVDDVAAFPDVTTAVDLGCGDGHLLAMLARRFPRAQLVGVDMSAEELELAHRRSLGQNVRLVAARADAIPLADASVDAVVCHMALMLFDDARAVVGEVTRILRPGGVFAAALGPAPGSSELVKSFGALLREAESREKLPPLQIGDAATFAQDSLLELFANDQWSTRAEELRLRFDGTDEQILAVLLGMYNVARLSEQGQTELAARLNAELIERRRGGQPAECVLGLRHLVARRK